MTFSTHNHSTGSDGKLTPEQVILKAIELKWDYIYFTDHYFVPKGLNFDYPVDFFNKKYIQDIKELKEKYKDKIEVYFGVEFNWIEGYSDWLKKEIQKQDYDYIIGSVHRIKFKEEYFDIEPGRENWIKNAEKTGNVKELIHRYYAQIKLMIKSNLFDSVAHFDYIKVYNEKQDLFSEKADWYRKEVLEVLDLIKKHKIVLEINASGIRKTGEQFPSLWIIKEARKRNIPITLGLDAHAIEHYDNKLLHELIEIAKQAGYNEVVRFKKRKMIKQHL